MNRLIRIYGLKCRHCLHELTGSMTLYFALQLGTEVPNYRVMCMCSLMDKRNITILRLGVITLQYDKVKDYDRHPPQYARVQIDKPGKACFGW